MRSPSATKTPLVAVVGNPNAGKTTLFNALTGSRQKVGNYPGVTVERVSGPLRLPSGTVECADVPGMYSLRPQSEDERVAAEAALGQNGLPQPDLLVVVIDAGNLERNLFLFSQLAEAGIPTLVALTMVDRLAGRAEEIDLPRLSNLLSVDVVPVVGHKERGLAELKAAIDRNLANPRVPDIRLTPDALEIKVTAFREELARLGADMTVAEVRAEVHEPSASFQALLDEHPEIRDEYDAARRTPEGQPVRDAEARYNWATMVQRAAIQRSSVAQKRSRTDRIDAILTHRVFGLIVFVAIMYMVFQSIYTFAQPMMDWIDKDLVGRIKDFASVHLESVPALQSLIVDGIITGVGAMLVFLPQILILFFFVAVLEGTGYLARAAFLMDRLLGWAGLNGRAFIPLLSSFACAIPGIMAARVMPDPKSRLATILVAPLMSCSARMPVYLVLVSAFIKPAYGVFWAGAAFFAMHFVGLFVAIPIVWVLNRKVLKGARLPFLLELPPYQWPKWKDVGLAMFFRGKVFVKTAGTIIVMMSVVVWALTAYPKLPAAQQSRIAASVGKEEAPKRIEEEQRRQSYLGRLGGTIEPVFRPAGFDWRITTSILASFPAREMFVSSMGIVFSLGDDVDEKDKGLQTSLQQARWPDGRPLFTPLVSVGLMFFFALCAQCMATLATVRRETNSWKWPAFMFTYMTLLAYVAAVAIYQIGIRL